MRRRDFLAASAAATAAVNTMTERFAWAADLPRDIKITRVTSFELKLTRPKHVGKNSYRHDHGPESADRVLRVHTNAGIDGFGTSWSGANECAQLLGKSPLDFFDRDARKVTGPLARYTAPVWDLVGKILEKPVWQLLRNPSDPDVDAEVPVYDGSIYFTDLRPPHLQNWPDEFKRELDMSLARGHRAFKVKIGRGRLWMLAEEGYQRDLEVVRLIRKHVGPDVLIGVDANDGYDFARTRRFVQDTADLNIAFIEEMFTEDVPKYLELKAFIRELGLNTLIADGENKRLPAEMQSWVEARAVDILQGDMNLFGFEDILAEAAMARPHGAMIAPHNWGSLFGFYLQLQVGRAIPNFYRAEEDPLSCKAVGTDGYRMRDGRCRLPDAPGLGLTLNDATLPEVACVHFDLKR
ncbi:MAG TPA: mandelate racemase/muconate lactonizing enzyme family protein [Phycisphaerae bacterium]|nr:mandelate racemase/muconate lactonizing enzyme family protein [Phycisphaerae bacterium]HPZ98046.1 mandelate racemase/muconate lactonizing enzyme family protein [Phycisphaerae bacterium]HQE30170.1 mandelate racemase/muconate lactonizing enzyme family protein [Phycisphaerae bacterium]